jgi:hypothetical protein
MKDNILSVFAMPKVRNPFDFVVGAYLLSSAAQGPIADQHEHEQ